MESSATIWHPLALPPQSTAAATSPTTQPSEKDDEINVFAPLPLQFPPPDVTMRPVNETLYTQPLSKQEREKMEEKDIVINKTVELDTMLKHPVHFVPTEKVVRLAVPIADFSGGPGGLKYALMAPGGVAPKPRSLVFALIRCTLERNGFQMTSDTDWQIMWARGHVSSRTLRQMNDNQIINHFPEAKEMTRKNRMWRNVQNLRDVQLSKKEIRRQKRAAGIKEDNEESDDFEIDEFLPQTYFLPAEYEAFEEEYLQRMAGTRKDPTVWIVKPIASSRGRGIYLIDNLSQLDSHKRCVVSEYIADPLLINGLKFDLRLYILVTSFSPLTIYWHDEGFTRFASVPYSSDPKHITNRFMHLTNYSVNKNNAEFIKNEDATHDDVGHKWSLSALWRYLKEDMNVDVDTLKLKIEDLIIMTVGSIQRRVTDALDKTNSHGKCFELYGFDVLLSSSLRPWLMEVNLTPSLLCDAPIDVRIKADVVSDVFNLVQIPKSTQSPGRVFPERSGGFRRIFPCTSPQRSKRYKFIVHTKPLPNTPSIYNSKPVQVRRESPVRTRIHHRTESDHRSDDETNAMDIDSSSSRPPNPEMIHDMSSQMEALEARRLQMIRSRNGRAAGASEPHSTNGSVSTELSTTNKTLKSKLIDAFHVMENFFVRAPTKASK
eukprot:GILK01005511.1.p1 GENE.GILK01005511.1~~GILK01005511.1.p1  ORF type:complete len:679 (+),score=93.09 GILK01005511.1:60-2039(+)